VSETLQGDIEVLVRRGDIRDVRISSAPAEGDVALSPNEVLLRVDKFGFTSNNVTYATLGEVMRYWDFFPAPEGWGRVPVWGYADVARSAHPEIEEGERIFGYLPMSAYLVVEAETTGEVMFVDRAAHRADLPPVYQRYARITKESGYKKDEEDLQALWRPLFMTSFGAADFLADKELFGARSVALSSASSKTALGIAFLLSQDRPSDCKVIALTSSGNVEFCRRLGYYDRVVPYEEIGSLDQTPTTLVDVAGNAQVVRDLRAHLGENFKKNIILGATHWESGNAGEALSAPDAEFFFLPPWLEKRRQDWGASEFGKRYEAAWSAFVPSVNRWMKVVHENGPSAVEGVYRDMVDGKVDPTVGHILSLRA
jgi:hypothetical protein